MSSHYHAVVWIDHHEARVFDFNREQVEGSVIHPDHPVRHIHHRVNAMGSGHAAENQQFFHDVVALLEGASTVLITGPANAKIELMKHIRAHAPALAEIVAGVETVDHPSDRSLVAYARQYFATTDRMRPQLRHH